MANTFIPVRLAYTGSQPTAAAEYQADEVMVMPGGMTLTGSGRRFTADMSNASVAARFAFQTNVPNSFSALAVIPNGTSQLTALAAFNSSDPGNSSVGQIIVDGASVQLSSTRTGTGSYLPLTTVVSGLERERIITSGGHLFGATAPNGIADASIANPGVFINSPSGTAAIQCITGEVNLWCSKRSITNNAFIAFAYQGTVTGTITTNGTTTAYNTSSDYRLKNTVEDLDKEEATARIMSFRPVTWLWNVDGSPGKGFIAHENQAVDPTTATGKKDEMRRVGNIRLPDYTLVAEAVPEPEEMGPYGPGAEWAFTEEQPVYQGRDDSMMIPDMIAMLQRQEARINELDTQLQQVLVLLPSA